MELAIPILPADDLRTAREFYVDGLGFDVRFEATEDGTTGLLGLATGARCALSPAPRQSYPRARAAPRRRGDVRTAQHLIGRARVDERPTCT